MKEDEKKLAPFVERGYRGTLIDDDFGVADDSDDQLVSEGTSLTESVAVAVVHHVEAAIHVNSDGSILLPPPSNWQRELRPTLGVQQRDPDADPHRHHDAADETCGHEPRPAPCVVGLTRIETHSHSIQKLS